MGSGELFYGSNVAISAAGEHCTVYKMKDAAGEGSMTRYRVLPGIDLLYNHFRTQGCISEFRPEVEMLAIDHCREGRIEWNLNPGSCLYLGERDLQIGTRENHAGGFAFPLGHYQGITVAVYMEEALSTLSTALGGLSVDLPGLRDKFCRGGRIFMMRADESIQHIFSELYTVPGKIKMDYFKVKVLELLLFLSAVDVPAEETERAYIPKKRAEAVKAVMGYLAENLDKRFTTEQLSFRFGIPATSLKECFKAVYGTSIYAYMRSYRIQAAAVLLRQSGDSVASIAAEVGYDNASKFASAFKALMGASPQEYRKSVVRME